jgi:cytochrome c553
MKCFLAVLALALPPLCLGDELPVFSPPGTILAHGHFVHRDGEALYRAICQGCHMPDARGAQGAGMYPALAANPKLASAAYPIALVLGGRHGMPSFAGSLTDAQIMEVVTYVRTHFGNAYSDKVTEDDVKRMRASLAPPVAQTCEPRRSGDLHIRSC